MVHGTLERNQTERRSRPVRVRPWHEGWFPGNGYVVKEITRCTRMPGDSGCSMGGKSIGERARGSEAAPAYGTIFCLVRLSLSYRSERALAQRPEGAGGNAARSFRHPRGRVANRARLPPSGCHANLCLACRAGGSQSQAGRGDEGGRAARHCKQVDFPGR